MPLLTPAIFCVSMFNFEVESKKEEDKKNFDRLHLQQSSGWIYDNNRIHKKVYKMSSVAPK